MIWAAAAVHLLTALGALAALFASVAIFEKNPERLFLWLGLALFIDAIDGTFARAVRVKVHLPRFSGEVLDLVIDYLTYVFVPILALLVFGKLEGAPGYSVAAGALLSSLYHFADSMSKDARYRFIGFPALWNVVAFYAFVFDLDAHTTAFVSLACIVAAFVPAPWVHPLRVQSLRPLTLAVLILGCVTALSVVVLGFPAGTAARAVLGIAGAYGLGLTLYWSAADR